MPLRKLIFLFRILFLTSTVFLFAFSFSAKVSASMLAIQPDGSADLSGTFTSADYGSNFSGTYNQIVIKVGVGGSVHWQNNMSAVNFVVDGKYYSGDNSGNLENGYVSSCISNVANNKIQLNLNGADVQMGSNSYSSLYDPLYGNFIGGQPYFALNYSSSCESTSSNKIILADTFTDKPLVQLIYPHYGLTPTSSGVLDSLDMIFSITRYFPDFTDFVATIEDPDFNPTDCVSDPISVNNGNLIDTHSIITHVTFHGTQCGLLAGHVYGINFGGLLNAGGVWGDALNGGGFGIYYGHPLPSCHDGVQNQNETSIDAGGVCDTSKALLNNFDSENFGREIAPHWSFTPTQSGTLTSITGYFSNLQLSGIQTMGAHLEDGNGNALDCNDTEDVNFNPLGLHGILSGWNNFTGTGCHLSAGDMYGMRLDNVQRGGVWAATPDSFTPSVFYGGIPDVVASCSTDCFSNVLFLPGLESSRLYKQKSVLGLPVEDQLWEPNVNSDVEDLYLNTNGTSKNLGIYTRDVIKESNTPISTGAAGQNIYKSFSDTMDKLVTHKKIKQWQAFPYDWRQSPDDVVITPQNIGDGNTASLISVLQSLVDSSNDGKVTIIAHSNGGLVAKALLKKLQDDKIAGRNNLIDNVDILILVAVPEIGTAKAVPAILHGYDQAIAGGLLMDDTHARELGRNMLSAYGLLPSKEYLNHVTGTPLATFIDNIIPSNLTTKLVKTFGVSVDSYNEYKNFLFGTEGRVNPPIDQTNLPISLSQDLFTKAENLHNSIDLWVPPSTMKVIEVAGWGLDTVASMEYYPRHVCSEQGVSGACGDILDERPVFTSDGDKTVVVSSAQYMSLNGNSDKYWVNLFQINNDKFPLDVNIEHKNILETKPILDIISSAINQTSVPDSIYLSKIAPIDTKNRLRLSIHSPVTLDAYDANGNHTGKICPPASDFCYAEENIPNSSYLEFGEGKYLNLPEDQAKSIKLQGTDVGTFTYDSQKVLPNGTFATSSFVDIPVTTQTQAEITLNPATQIPQLALDVTGDGVTDFTLVPNTTFDPVTYLQVMRATIDSLDLAPAKIKAFDTRVDNIIKSIQKGKIDKAKLKADKFESVLEKKLAKGDPKKPKPKKLSKTDAQLLLDMLNTLLDNIN